MRFVRIAVNAFAYAPVGEHQCDIDWDSGPHPVEIPVAFRNGEHVRFRDVASYFLSAAFNDEVFRNPVTADILFICFAGEVKQHPFRIVEAWLQEFLQCFRLDVQLLHNFVEGLPVCFSTVPVGENACKKWRDHLGEVIVHFRVLFKGVPAQTVEDKSAMAVREKCVGRIYIVFFFFINNLIHGCRF